MKSHKLDFAYLCLYIIYARSEREDPRNLLSPPTQRKHKIK